MVCENYLNNKFESFQLEIFADVIMFRMLDFCWSEDRINTGFKYFLKEAPRVRFQVCD